MPEINPLAAPTINEPEIYMLSGLRGDFAPDDRAETEPSEISGVPAQYRWKDMLSAGDWKTSGGTLHAPPWRLREWCDKLNQMVAAGIDIPITSDENHQIKTATNMGFLKGARIAPDGRLEGRFQLIGQDAALLAARNRVSVVVSASYRDGKGHLWGSAITSVCLTPQPVVSGQHEFKASSTAAAHDGAIPIYAAAKELPMGDTMLPCSETHMSTLSKHVKGLSNIANEGKVGHVVNHLDDVHSRIKRLAGVDDNDDYDHAACLSSLVKGGKHKLSASSLDDDGRSELALLKMDKIDARAWPAELKTRLKAMVRGEQSGLFMLSRHEEYGLEKTLIDTVVDLLDGLKFEGIATPGERTAGQFHLSRSVPDPDGINGAPPAKTESLKDWAVKQGLATAK